MTSIFVISLLSVGAFFVGGIPFGLIIARLLAHEDIRSVGSGNIGTTNVARSAGSTAGVLTLVCDAGKGFLSVCVARLVLSSVVDGGSVALDLGGAYHWAISFVYACCVLGHIFSPFLHFHGGKGIAVGFGGGLALNWPMAVMAFLVFLALALPTQYVSLGSVGAAVAIGVFAIIFGEPPFSVLCILAVGATVVWAHRENLSRLSQGSERKFSIGSKDFGEKPIEEDKEKPHIQHPSAKKAQLLGNQPQERRSVRREKGTR